MSENKGNGQAMVVARADSRTALEPRNFDEGWRLAEIAATTRMYGVTSPEDAFLRMSTGMGLGLSAPQSLRGLFTISGKVGISADLMMALSQQHPACRYFHCVETTNEIATFVTKRGENEEVRLSFTMAEARDAGLVGQNQNYKKYPAAMLRARCIAALARLVYPEALHGLYTREEFGETERDPTTVNAESVAPRVEVMTEQPQRKPEPPALTAADLVRDLDADHSAECARAVLSKARQWPKVRGRAWRRLIGIAVDVASVGAVCAEMAEDGLPSEMLAILNEEAAARMVAIAGGEPGDTAGAAS